MKRWGKKVPYGFVHRVSRQLGKRATQALVAAAYGGLSTAANSATGGLLGGSAYNMGKAGWRDGKKFYKSAFPRARYAKLASNKYGPRRPVLSSNKGNNKGTGSNKGPVLGSNPDKVMKTKQGMAIKYSKRAHSKFIKFK